VVPADKPLRELGLDSLMAVELRNALGRRAGVTLPSTLAFDHPTSAAIAKYLLDEVPAFKAAREGSPFEPAAPAQEPVPTLEPGPALETSRAIARREDRIETIPMGERWIADAFRVIPTAGGFAQRAVDLTWALQSMRALNAAGIRATLPHVIIRAASLALARNPELHQTVCGYRRLTPGAVDIGLSMAGQTTYAPVVVLPSVDRQTLGELVPAVEAAVAAAREKERVDLDNLRKVGWMTPIGFLRRFAVRTMQNMFWYRRKIVGTFQVTAVPTADACVPFQFYTGSILSFGRPRDAVVAIEGRPEVRPMLTLTLVADHVAMDGLRAAMLVNEIAAILESDELVQEASATSVSASSAPPPNGITGEVRALPPGPRAAPPGP
jgi:pyruvate/2-oxoglutarate dehydrogenase complex dihydrolipoamide acyltransferase (E2) component